MISRQNLTSLAGYLLLFSNSCPVVIVSLHVPRGRPLEGLWTHRCLISNVIRQSIHSLHMKDAQDASNYVGKHAHSCANAFFRMGAPYPRGGCIFQLLRGLPKSSLWPHSGTIDVLFPRAAPFRTSAVRSHLRAAFRAYLPRQHVRSTRTTQ